MVNAGGRNMTVRVFGETDGQRVEEVTIRSAAGAEAKILTWGAVVRDLVVPLGGGGRQRVVLGLNTLDDYLAHSPHFGAVAGRYANRIAHGRFHLDGELVEVPRNQAGKHMLHGGGAGFGKRPWRLAHAGSDAVALTLVSPDGDAGFPGNLTVTCLYVLREPATLAVELSASTDAPTVVNLAHHSYFNLDGSPDVLDHALQIAGAFMTPVDEELIPTGEIRAVAETPFDFRTPRPLRHPGAGGEPFHYDHNFVLAGPAGVLRPAAMLRSPKNGLGLEVYTTEPGLQLYDGAKMNCPVPGLDGAHYGSRAGLCLEAQRFPDSPNRAHFPSTVLRPGEVYRQVTEYRFG
jgi:aldose 1-epimerase